MKLSRLAVLCFLVALSRVTHAQVPLEIERQIDEISHLTYMTNHLYKSPFMSDIQKKIAAVDDGNARKESMDLLIDKMLAIDFSECPYYWQESGFLKIKKTLKDMLCRSVPKKDIEFLCSRMLKLLEWEKKQATRAWNLVNENRGEEYFKKDFRDFYLACTGEYEYDLRALEWGRNPLWLSERKPEEAEVARKMIEVAIGRKLRTAQELGRDHMNKRNTEFLDHQNLLRHLKKKFPAEFSHVNLIFVNTRKPLSTAQIVERDYARVPPEITNRVDKILHQIARWKYDRSDALELRKAIGRIEDEKVRVECIDYFMWRMFSINFTLGWYYDQKVALLEVVGVIREVFNSFDKEVNIKFLCSRALKLLAWEKKHATRALNLVDKDRGKAYFDEGFPAFYDVSVGTYESDLWRLESGGFPLNLQERKPEEAEVARKMIEDAIGRKLRTSEELQQDQRDKRFMEFPNGIELLKQLKEKYPEEFKSVRACPCRNSAYDEVIGVK